MGGLPPVFVEFLGSSKGVKTAMKDVQAEMAVADASGAGAFKKTGMLGKAAIAGLGIAAIAVTKQTVQMAANFETQMTRVRTGAGESAANMHLVGQGVLAMAGEVGQSTSELTSGLYMVESAGYHGADALTVLEASAKGAKVGVADLHTVTDAVTTAMNAYKSGVGSATEVTNSLIATEAEGKTNLEALAGSMASILPAASAAHVGLNEILGAMATMTAQGTPAANAATYLRQTVGALSNPSGKAAAEMKDLGLSAVQVGQNLGKNGLASTLEMLTGAITQHMGPAGTVLIKHLQDAAKNTSAYQKVLANLSPSQQTYIGALATMVGGTKSMQAALMLTGPHMADFKKNTAGIAEHVKAGGKEIEGWADVQKTFNQKTAEAKASLESLGIQIGQHLMPYVQQVVGVIATSASWMAKHTVAAEIAAGVIGGVLVFALAAVTAQLISMAIAAAANPITWIVLAVVLLIVEIVLLVTHWKQVWAVIKEITAATVDWIIGAWHWLANGTTSIWHSITGAAVGAWNATASFFSTAWHAVADPVVGAWHWIEGVTATVWNGISGFFAKWWPLLLLMFSLPIGLLVAGWNHFHEQIFAAARAVWGAVSMFLHATWLIIVGLAHVAWGAVRAAIIDPIAGAWSWLVGAWHAIAAWLGGQWRSVRNTASSIWGSIRSAMTGPISSAYHTISTTMSSVKKSISDQLHSAYQAVAGVGSWFEGIGAAIVHGIVSGVSGAAGSLYDSLTGLANDALGKAKSFLGINSPSKVFADHVGMAIPEGIAKGVRDHAYLAHGAVGGLADGLASNRVDFGGGLPGSAAVMASNRGGTQITHVHVNVAGHVLSEKNLRDVVEQQMLGLGRRNPQTYASAKR